ncbi:MAG: hypothetical protein ABH887_00470 [bacterium]
MSKKIIIIAIIVIAVLALATIVYFKHSFKKCENCALSTSQLSPFGGHICYTKECHETAKEIGIKFLRGGIGEKIIWEVVEPNLDGDYNWKNIDNAFKEVENYGFELMETIKATNQKDQRLCHSDCRPNERCKYNPCNWDKYEDFLREAVNRYKEKIKYWQIENEPAKGNYYWGTPEEYAELLKKSYKVIKAECPDCKVLNAGMMYCNYVNEYHDYFPAMMKSLSGKCNSTGCFDIFDIHIGESCVGDQQERIDFSKIHSTINIAYNDIIELLSSNNIPLKPFWVSEFGPLTCKNCLGIEDALIKSYITGLEQGFEKLFWRLSEAPSWIIDDNSNKTNSFYAYKTLVKQIDNYTDIEKITDGQYKFTFSHKNSVYVLWCDSELCSLPSEIQGQVTITNYQGDKTLTNANQIKLLESPIFVETN